MDKGRRGDGPSIHPKGYAFPFGWGLSGQLKGVYMQQINIKYSKWNLIAWLNEQDGNALVAVTPICDAIGIQSARQRQKIESDPRFRSTHRYSPSVGGPQDTLCIPASQVAGWLYGINSRKVSPEVAPLLLEFQQNVTQAIYAAVPGQANSDVVADLNRRIDTLTEQVAALMQMVKEVQQENNELHQRLDYAQPSLSRQASAAGSALQAQRYIKPLRSN